MVSSFALQRVRRYYRQVHWEMESREAYFNDRAEPGLKLENVAAHSWHVSDSVMIISQHFPRLDINKAIKLSILHDKLEMYTGDYDPVGPDGQGAESHAFNETARQQKKQAELNALDEYLETLRPSIRQDQRDLLIDIIFNKSQEALFVKSIDKLQALAFVYEKKRGRLTDAHLLFSIRYSRKAVELFPGVIVHYRDLLNRLLDSVAKYRHTTRPYLDRYFLSQMEMDLRSNKPK